MAIIVNQKGQQNFGKQLIPSGIGTGSPIIAYDAIAVDYSSKQIDDGMGGTDTEYNWTPLSSYLGEMKDMIKDAANNAYIDLSVLDKFAEKNHIHTEYAESSHNHSAANINSGTLNTNRLPNIPFDKLPTGTGAEQVALGNHTHSDYSLSTHTHNKATSTSFGIVSVSVSGTGTPTSVSFKDGKLTINCETPVEKETNIISCSEIVNISNNISKIVGLTNSAKVNMTIYSPSAGGVFDGTTSVSSMGVADGEDVLCYYTGSADLATLTFTVTTKGTDTYKAATKDIYVNFTYYDAPIVDNKLFNIFTVSESPIDDSSYYSTYYKKITASNIGALPMQIDVAKGSLSTSLEGIEDINSTSLNNIANNVPFYCYYIPSSSSDIIPLTVTTPESAKYYPGYAQVYLNFKSAQSTPTKPSNIDVESITLSLASELNVGNKSTTATATVSPANATDKTVTWESLDPDIISISPLSDNNKAQLTAIKPGTGTIKATSVSNSSVSGSKVITINKSTGASVSTKLSDTITCGSYYGIATITPTTNTGQKINVSIPSNYTSASEAYFVKGSDKPTSITVNSGESVKLAYVGKTDKPTVATVQLYSESSTWYNAGSKKTFKFNIPIAPEDTSDNTSYFSYYYYVGTKANMPTSVTYFPTTSEKLTTVTFDTSDLSLFVYPTSWGTATKLIHPETNYEYGSPLKSTDVDKIIADTQSEYAAITIPAVNLTAIKGAKMKIKWS